MAVAGGGGEACSVGVVVAMFRGKDQKNMQRTAVVAAAAAAAAAASAPAEKTAVTGVAAIVEIITTSSGFVLLGAAPLAGWALQNKRTRGPGSWEHKWCLRQTLLIMVLSQLSNEKKKKVNPIIIGCYWRATGFTS